MSLKFTVWNKVDVEVAAVEIVLPVLDWMVENGELREITDENVMGQHRVFVARGGA